MGAATTNQGRRLRGNFRALGAMTAEQLLEQPRQSCAIDVAPTGSRVICSSAWLRAGPRCSGSRSRLARSIVCSIDLKVARLAHEPRHLDSSTDVAGYAAILAELLPNG